MLYWHFNEYDIDNIYHSPFCNQVPKLDNSEPCTIEPCPIKHCPVDLRQSTEICEAEMVEPEISAISVASPLAHFSIPTSTRLRERLKQNGRILACPGVYDGFSARIALSVGFDALYMTGAGTTASRLGQADIGVAQLYDMRANAEMIANLDTSVPLIADMDTGYGGPVMVARSVSEYIRAGVAGFHLEDQVEPKRCGHLSGKRVVNLQTYEARIRAAVLARDRLRSDIVIIGRTDALQQHGYDEAILRLKVARDAGADVGLLEGITSKDMVRQAVKDLWPLPMMLNMVDNGVTPTISVLEAQEMGYKIINFSFATLTPVYVAIREALETLKRTGITTAAEGISPRFLFDVCGLQENVVIDKKCGGNLDNA